MPGFLPDGSGGSNTITAGFLFGDRKLADRTDDHDAWIYLDGRPKSSLSALQRAHATALGYLSNIPDARDRVPMGSSAAKLPNSTGGSATATIAQANLPNINLTTAGISAGTPTGSVQIYTHSGTGGGSDPNPTSGVSNLQQTDRTPENIITLGNTMGGGFSGNALPAHAHSTPLGGSGSALPILPPYLACSIFAYLGSKTAKTVWAAPHPLPIAYGTIDLQPGSGAILWTNVGNTTNSNGAGTQLFVLNGWIYTINNTAICYKSPDNAQAFAQIASNEYRQAFDLANELVQI